MFPLSILLILSPWIELQLATPYLCIANRSFMIIALIAILIASSQIDSALKSFRYAFITNRGI